MLSLMDPIPPTQNHFFGIPQFCHVYFLDSLLWFDIIVFLWFSHVYFLESVSCISLPLPVACLVAEAGGSRRVGGTKTIWRENFARRQHCLNLFSASIFQYFSHLVNIFLKFDSWISLGKLCPAATRHNTASTCFQLLSISRISSIVFLGFDEKIYQRPKTCFFHLYCFPINQLTEMLKYSSMYTKKLTVCCSSLA